MFSTGILGSRSWAMTTSQKAPSVAASGWVKKRISGTFVHPLEDNAAGHLVPMVRLVEHVVVRVAPVHLRGDAIALARELVRIARLLARPEVRQMLRAPEVPPHRHQRSRPNAAAASPIPPTSASDPGASSGGPMTMLNSGSWKPPGLRATPRTWVITPIAPSRQ